MTKKNEVIICTILLILTVFFSTYKLKESPSVWYDEGLYIQTAASVADGMGMMFQFAPGHLVDMMPRFTVGYPFIYILAIVFKIFGTSVIAARSLMVFLILCLAISAYFLLRKKSGPVQAIYSLALIITFPPLYGNGKSALGEVPALLLLVLCLISFQYALSFKNKKQSKLWIILAGFLAGLCAAAKLSFLLFLPAFALIFIFMWRRDRFSKSDVALAGLFSFLPVAVWALVQYYGLDSSLTVLNFYANPYGVSNLLTVVKDNIIHFFTEAGPLYLLIMMAVWIVAIILRKKRKEDILPEEMMAFVFCVLVFLAYLRIVGFHRYIFPAHIIALLYFIPSFSICVQWFSDKTKIKFPVVSLYFKRLIVPAVVVLLSLWGIYGIFFNSWVADSYQSHKTAFWENYFRNVPPEKSFFFYDAPEVTIFSHSRNYYQYLPLLPVGGPFGTEWLKVIEEGKVDEIIVRTDILEGKKDWFLKNYHPMLQTYKYTILDRSLVKK